MRPSGDPEPKMTVSLQEGTYGHRDSEEKDVGEKKNMVKTAASKPRGEAGSRFPSQPSGLQNCRTEKSGSLFATVAPGN